MVSTASRNKARGRAYQAKLAEMTKGINVGTLGGEDVMHEEFSFEAKTYNPKCKSHAGKDWYGEQLMSYYENRESSKQIVLKVTSGDPDDEDIMMMRFTLWEDLSNLTREEWDKEVQVIMCFKNRFLGRTYMNQAEKNCPDGKLPVVCVHTTGKRHKSDLVLIYRIYWNSLLKKLFDKSL